MGGAGTWHMLSERPDFFAAGAPVCGRYDPKIAGSIRHVPVWNFHGDKDETVSVTFSRELIAALKKAGGAPKYSEYAGVGHNSFLWAYTEPELVEWMFAQRRK